MSENQEQPSVLELQARWNKIRIANLYDTLDQMGYPNQCIDLSIRPLFPGQHLAGVAITARGTRDPRSREEKKADAEKAKAKGDTPSGPQLNDLLFPGCVVVVDGGGEPYTGKFGEMTSWSLKQAGAKGIVIDGYIRDLLGLEVIPDYTVCSRGTSPIESNQRWSIVDVNVTIGMPGTLTNQVAVHPGDWIIGGPDGVIVVPQEIAMEALEKAEEIEAREQGMREDLAAGMSFKDAYEKWGRA
ncbi:MAG: RraA family protein [Anaerolineae bacterium]